MKKKTNRNPCSYFITKLM